MPPARPEWIDAESMSSMSPRDRLLEVASILACGLRRHLAGASKNSPESSPDRLEVPEHAGRHLTGPVVSAGETERRP